MLDSGTPTPTPTPTPIPGTLPVRVRTPARPALAPVTRRRWVPVVGGGLGLLLAGLGEVLVEGANPGILSLLLYLAGIALFTASAWLLPPAPTDLTRAAAAAPARPAPAWRRWSILGGGVAVAVVLNLMAQSQLYADLKSVSGTWLWLGSLAVLLAAGLAIARTDGWAPRWAGGAWPGTRRGRALLLLALAAILVLAVAARFWALDSIPLGINADEGDRASTAIRIIHGTDTDSMFASGWYWISMVYFSLLAALMKVIGIGYVQARVFGAIAGVLAVATTTWIGGRHFGWRVGLLAGGLTAVLAVALQFSRETSEAGPTATLWAISMALFLEAARGGRLWAWIGAGLAGGFSLYFYPSARLWAILAALFCAYLFVHGLGGQRAAIVRGTVLAAAAALLIAMPFFVNGALHPEGLTIRAQETSIFTGDNPTRLSYYHQDWSLPQLLSAQVVRSVGVFNQFHDDGGFWPTDRPLMAGLLAVLTLLGLGWVCLRWRDPRFVALALWFWVGLSGVIVTVETPNVQRLATAVPMLALLPALALDSLARRVEQAAAERGGPRPRLGVWAASGVVALMTLWLMAQQAQFYFGEYAHTDRWPQPTGLGRGVAAQGADTLVVTLARQYHMVNAGWVQLMAADTPRGGVEAAGSNLPLALPPDHNLAFLLTFRQPAYFPYLRELYPGGVTTPYTHTTEGLMFTVYRITQQQWADTRGAMVAPVGQGSTLGSAPAHVDALGQAPPGWTAYPSPMRWTAGLRVPQYWNYSFRIGPGPARLTVDGTPVLTVPAGTPVLSATVALARGDHALAYDGTLTEAGRPAQFEWASDPAPPGDGTAPPSLDWHAPGPDALDARQTAPRGLYAVVQVADHADQHRLDNTLASGAFANQIHTDGAPYTATWTGSLTAPVTGVYSMTLFAQGAADLTLDGKPVFHTDKPQDDPAGASVSLTAGAHAVHFVFQGHDGPGGLEWIWTPPGGETSIVPPAVLAPPPGLGVGPPVPFSTLGKPDIQPTDQGLATIR